MDLDAMPSIDSSTRSIPAHRRADLLEHTPPDLAACGREIIDRHDGRELCTVGE
jgi:hypothetical protein